MYSRVVSTFKTHAIGQVTGSTRCITTSSALMRNKTSRKVLPKIYASQFWKEPEYTSTKSREVTYDKCVLPDDLQEIRFKFPEFLPPDDPRFRNPVMLKLEREDMLKRRQVLDVPEFYVGTIMSVTVSDPHAPGRVSRFVGICISRDGQGLRSNFTLRNYIENEGVEIRYDIYNPTIRSIEVIRLEKRLDPHLLYLRDADPEFSTFPLDMEYVEPTYPVPVNDLKVRMKPWPWTQSWEVEFPHIRGIEKLENVPDWYYNRSRRSHPQFEKYDMMLDYRTHIPEDDQKEIWEEVKQHEETYAEKRKIEKRKKLLQKKR